jgi:Xaa-Pro aminopeptidase
VGWPEHQLERPLRDARRAFAPAESLRFRRLGAATAAALTDALCLATPERSEQWLAASVTAELVTAGADPLVVLVAGESRLAYRHALPTNGPLGRRALVTVCARAHGLIANASRWITFEPATAAEQRADEAIRLVESELFAATRPGVRLSEVLAVAAAAYPRHGFAEDEWRRHHQGGPAGYAGRDPRATPDTNDVIVVGEHFAWNPSAPGTKIEDTVQLTANGIEPITIDPRWPTVELAGLHRPVALEL